ncbi:uncharacterized protein LOC126985757 [Eriocheir sinensis]|uniref:uncharacterized protein LOC126985757 n=1 Tax=Eriocheir sinensis TaxID=95602 RepID=UPI0021C9E925|nr:uncharacterized protein LOC126985757 [Eriocheir sinensis]
MLVFGSVLVGLLTVAVGAAVAETVKSDGGLNTKRKIAFFHPEQPLLGNVPPGPLGEAHLRLKVHDVAFMLRALRTVVRDVRPGAPDGGREPLTSRFPASPMPEDRKVRRHCRHGFVPCVTYLSRVAHTLSLSTQHDPPTLKQGRRKGMCFRKSRRLSIFCDPRHRKPQETKEISTEVKKGVSSAMEQVSRAGKQSISTRMKTVKPTVTKNVSIIGALIHVFVKKIKTLAKAEVKEKKVLSNVRKASQANKLELYRQTVTALQYMCWYTMHGVPYLAHLLQCDSSDSTRKQPDGDLRAGNDDPFGCALYSFCPNPCCGGLREPSKEDCWNRFSNPCRLHGLKGGRGCKIPREQNLNYNLLVDHGVQVTCDCGAGRRYEPVAGMCVWRDHCLHPAAACPKPHQHCFNLFGSHGCRCDPDYRWSDYNQRCVPLYPTKKKEEEEEEEEEDVGDELVEKVNDCPIIKWLNKQINTTATIPPERTLNYNWSRI